MKQFFIISQTIDPDITNDVLIQIAEALAVQNQRDFAPEWDGKIGPDGVEIDAKATFSIAANDAVIPINAIPIFIQDTIDVPSDLGYHDLEGENAVIRIGWEAIKSNGGTILTGSNSLSVTISHEVCETLADINANGWVTKADGVTKLAYEVCDPCEGNSYNIDATAVGSLPTQPVAMSNFCFYEFFIVGSKGKLDFLGLLPVPLAANEGGYEIDMDQQGKVTDVFAKSETDGGYPGWKKVGKAKKLTNPLPGMRLANRYKAA